jgi:hypothetical protein
MIPVKMRTWLAARETADTAGPAPGQVSRNVGRWRYDIPAIS